MMFEPIFEVVRGAIRIAAVEHIAAGENGRRAMEIAFGEAAKLATAIRLHLDVDARTVAEDSRLSAFLSELGRCHAIDPARVVVELTHYAAPMQGRALRRGIDGLRSAGFGIAIGDVRREFWEWPAILQLRPDFLKVRRWLTGSIQDFPGCQFMIRTLVEEARRFGARVIAAGIEKGPEFSTVRALGIELMQGSLLAPPLAVK
jgi:EAL domain-containing protein (putative c-di-GMP-specific phosphodiesterase class I)